MQDDIRLCPFQLGHERGKIRGGGRISLFQHEFHAVSFDAHFIAGGDSGAVWSVFMDDGDPDILDILAESRFRVMGDKIRRNQPILIAMNLGSEYVFEVSALEHGGRHTDIGPHEFFLRIHLGGHRNALSAGIKAQQQINFFLAEQPFRLVDGNLHLALCVGINRIELITFDPTPFIDHIDGDLGPHGPGFGSAGRIGSGVVEYNTDFNLFCHGRGTHER